MINQQVNPSPPSATAVTSRPAPARRRALGVAGAAGLTLLLVGWLFLHQLGGQPLQYWDEARTAMNALNIGLHHDHLVMYYGRFPDSLRTKPPVLPNLVAWCYAVFGVSTWSLRLPAALAGVLTAAGLGLFAARGLRQPWVGLLAAVALATMPGFNGPHVARNGEYDALLALLTVSYSLSAYCYGRQPRRRYLLLFGAALAGALLIKCSAALLPLPGLALYAWRYGPPGLWRERRIWRTGMAAGAPLLVFYVLRELAYPGYLHFTWDNDWAGRAMHALTGATPWWYYFPALWRGLGPWAGVGLVCLGLGWWLVRPLPQVVIFALWQLAGLLLVVSAAQSRLPWYIAHAYPLLALAIASLAAALAARTPPRRRWLVPAALSLVSAGAVFATVARHEALAQAPLAPFQQYGPALRQLDRLPLPAPAVVVVTETYNPLFDYYQRTGPPLRRVRLERLRLLTKDPAAQVRELLPGQQVFGCLPEVRRLVEQHFVTTPLARPGACWCVRLERRR